MELYLILALILVLIAACALVTISFLSGGGKHSRVAKRLEEIKRLKAKGAVALESGKESGPLTNILVSCGRLVSPKNEASRKALERRLHGAGIYSEKGLLIFLGIRVLVPAGLVLIVLFLFPVLRHHPIVFTAALLGSILLGVFAPPLIVGIMGRKRRTQILRGFPDALDLLAVCVEAGVGFDTAIKRVAEEMAFSHGDISREFMSYIYETQIGIPRHEALRNLGERTNVDIIRSFISLLIQSDKLGTSIVQTLRVYSDSLRTIRRQNAETKAARLPVIMVFPLVFCIFPSLYIIIIGPAMITIFKNLLGTWI